MTNPFPTPRSRLVLVGGTYVNPAHVTTVTPSRAHEGALEIRFVGGELLIVTFHDNPDPDVGRREVIDRLGQVQS